MNEQIRLGVVFLSTFALIGSGCDGTNTGGAVGFDGGAGGALGIGGRTGMGGSSATGIGGSSATSVGGNTGSVAANCAKLCGTMIAMGCPSDVGETAAVCESDCSSVSTTAPSCSGQYNAWLACYVAQPTSSWTCDDSGSAALGTGICASQTTAMVNCIGA
jgi:hypothetical protein